MIVISSRAAGRYAALIERQPRLPLVLVNNDPPPGAYSVRMDNEAAASDALRYLQALGHRRIAFVEGPPAGRSSRERRAGYQTGLSLLGLAQDADLLVPGSGRLEDGLPAIERLMALRHPPSAVLCYNDLAAIGLLAAASAAGLRVPEQLSVVGFDNIPLSRFTVPPLTTVDQPKQQMGGRAVALCLGHLEPRSLTEERPAEVALQGRLVVRQSAAPPGQPAAGRQDP
jgi:DNA-binding LacI/PurR family transcriptional regulator